MKKQYVILSGLALSVLMIFLLVEHKNASNPNGSSIGKNGVSNNETIGSNQGGENHPDQPPTGVSGSSEQALSKNGSNGSNPANGTLAGSDQKAIPAPKQNDCFRFAYQHEAKNQNRDIEDFLNDTNAFPIAHANVNQKSICVKVNDKPVNHKLIKKDGKTEVLIGSVVGPESTIQVSYCTGSAPCKEACAVKTNNKVDELLSDSEVGGLENAELETQVKELRNVASVHGDLMDSTVIRDWNKLQSKEWVCEK